METPWDKWKENKDELSSSEDEEESRTGNKPVRKSTNLQQGINNCKKDSSKINLADNGWA